MKRIIKDTIDNLVDHRLLIPTVCNKTHWQQESDTVWVDFTSLQGGIHLACPEQAFALIPSEMIDFESVNLFYTLH